MYATKQRLERRKIEFSDQSQPRKEEIAPLFDPSILRSARQIYRTFYEVHTESRERPSGVAIDKQTLRGKLIFHHKPILLPNECFVPLSQIESEVF